MNENNGQSTNPHDIPKDDGAPTDALARAVTYSMADSLIREFVQGEFPIAIFICTVHADQKGGVHCLMREDFNANLEGRAEIARLVLTSLAVDGAIARFTIDEKSGMLRAVPIKDV